MSFLLLLLLLLLLFLLFILLRVIILEYFWSVIVVAIAAVYLIVAVITMKMIIIVIFIIIFFFFCIFGGSDHCFCTHSCQILHYNLLRIHPWNVYIQIKSCFNCTLDILLCTFREVEWEREAAFKFKFMQLLFTTIYMN